MHVGKIYIWNSIRRIQCWTGVSRRIAVLEGVGHKHERIADAFRRYIVLRCTYIYIYIVSLQRACTKLNEVPSFVAFLFWFLEYNNNNHTHLHIYIRIYVQLAVCMYPLMIIVATALLGQPAVCLLLLLHTSALPIYSPNPHFLVSTNTNQAL